MFILSEDDKKKIVAVLIEAQNVGRERLREIPAGVSYEEDTDSIDAGLEDIGKALQILLNAPTLDS